MYASSRDRIEFTNTDRATLNTIAQTAITMMDAPPQRTVFDAWINQINGLAPTLNINGPFPDVR
jgi:hypothetical protein